MLLRKDMSHEFGDVIQVAVTNPDKPKEKAVKKNWKYYLSFIIIIPSIVNTIDIGSDGSITFTEPMFTKTWAAVCLILGSLFISNFFKQLKRKRIS